MSNCICIYVRVSLTSTSLYISFRQCRTAITKADIHYVRNKKDDTSNGYELTRASSHGSVDSQSAAESSNGNLLGGVGLDVTDTQLTSVQSKFTENVKGSWGSKIEHICSVLLNELDKDVNTKVIIFSEWNEVLTVISRALQANSILYQQLTSSFSKLQNVLQTFKHSTAIRVLLLPLKRGSAGVNITEAQHVMFVEPSLQPAKEHQAIGRIYRMGQRKETHIHRFIINKSIEQKIMKMTHDMQINRTNSHDNKVTNSAADTEYTEMNDMLSGGKNEKLENVLTTKQLNALLSDSEDNDTSHTRTESSNPATGSKHQSKHHDNRNRKNEKGIVINVASSICDDTKQSHDDDDNDMMMDDDVAAIDSEFQLVNELQQQKAMEAEYWNGKVVVNHQHMPRYQALEKLQRNYYFNKKLSKNADVSQSSIHGNGGKQHHHTSVHYGKLLHQHVIDELNLLPTHDHHTTSTSSSSSSSSKKH
jgi:hypothetical protein